MEYETVIGLEVHVELKTRTKVFCSCPTTFGAKPNTQVCPVCLGLPGVLPVLNEKAVEFTIQAALALNCQIAGFSKFDRKNYFYPDMPKDYQISQYDLPLAAGGHIDINLSGENKRIRIKRLHLEEDTGKLLHSDDLAAAASSLVDFNRAGVPLIEIVSEPDIRSPEEARLYLNKLKGIIEYTGVSDVKMQEGSLRCDANVSLRPKGAKEFGTRTEIKNMNSFRAVQRGLEYEVERQKKVLESGGKVLQETRHWDETRGITVSLRSKEEAHDYRYFPEPDLAPLVISREWVQEIRHLLPELPAAKKARLIEVYRLPEYDAEVLTSSKALGDFFDATVASYPEAKTVSNWMMGELMKYLNARNLEIGEIPLTPGLLADLLRLIDQGTISGKIAKTIFEEMCSTGQPPEKIVQEKGLVQISDEGAIARVVEEVIAGNQQSVADYRAGKEKALTFLVGQVMKVTRGKANPEAVNRILREKLQS
ncbi:MAG: Asp-tRNA(Asn)/Glu-tRNA(Gln) amidotransferase subunit GatB [Firmicutes bacterium]|nr:Asp-tRNA(Asn)/Glu-tRNA(Gln) amidotransferase subunit GatB [Bacillota bacterium]